MARNIKKDLSSIPITDKLTQDIYSDLKEYKHNNLTDLDRQLARLPKKISWWSLQATGCKSHLEKLKEAFDRYKAKTRLSILKVAKKRVSQSAINDILILKPKYKKWQDRIRKWERRYNTLNEQVWALRSKEKTLIASSYIVRSLLDIQIYKKKEDL